MSDPRKEAAGPSFVQRSRITVAGIFCGVRESVLTRQVRGKIRRFFLSNFRPGYVRRQLALRHGDCKQCGVCCGLGNTCPVLHGARHCLIYNGWRPRACRLFPIDRRDLADVEAAGGHCSYSFAPDSASQAPHR